MKEKLFSLKFIEQFSSPAKRKSEKENVEREKKRKNYQGKCEMWMRGGKNGEKLTKQIFIEPLASIHDSGIEMSARWFLTITRQKILIAQFIY